MADFLLRYDVYPSASPGDQTIYGFQYSKAPDEWFAPHFQWKGSKWELTEDKDLPEPESSDYWNIFPERPVHIYESVEALLSRMYLFGGMVDTEPLLGFTVRLDVPLQYWIKQMITWETAPKTSQEIMLAGISTYEDWSLGFAGIPESSMSDLSVLALMVMHVQSDDYFLEATGTVLTPEAERTNERIWLDITQAALNKFVADTEGVEVSDLLGGLSWTDVMGSVPNMKVLISSLHDSLDTLEQYRKFGEALSTALQDYEEAAWGDFQGLIEFRSVVTPAYQAGDSVNLHLIKVQGQVLYYSPTTAFYFVQPEGSGDREDFGYRFTSDFNKLAVSHRPQPELEPGDTVFSVLSSPDSRDHVIIEQVTGNAALISASENSIWFPLALLEKSPDMTPVGTTLPLFHGHTGLQFYPSHTVTVRDFIGGELLTIYEGVPIGKRHMKVEPEYCIYAKDRDVLWVTRSLLEEVSRARLMPWYSPETIRAILSPGDELSTPQIGVVVMALFFVVWSLD